MICLFPKCGANKLIQQLKSIRKEAPVILYPKNFIEELKMRNDLETVISKYVVLKRAGSNLVGCCPFHSERTPSFTVFPEKNFYCFGCGAGGDVITFTMRIENLDYRNAVRYLADAAGIPVPEENTKYEKKEVLTRERNYEMNKIAARHFYDNLMSPEGKPGLEYLLSRKLLPSTIRHFGLGFAKNSFDDLYKTLIQKGFTTDEIKAGFLCGISSKGVPFDMFRNRVMFPIIDVSGHIIAFGGRVMDDSKPKYLNSSDTPVFKKRSNLFALNFAKNSCVGAGNENGKAKSGELILCEGYMDVIALHQAGFSGAVATLGTAVTPEQARIISRYAKTLYVSYDTDEAGRRADEKAIKYMNEVGVDVKILKVTGGAKDPDEYIKKYGPEGFRRLMNGASGQIDYQLSEIISKYNLDIPEEKLAMINEACTLIAGSFSEMKREVCAIRLSELTGINKDAVISEIKRKTIKKISASKKELEKNSEESLRHYGDKINPDALKNIRGASTEEQILGILLLYPEYLENINSEIICESDFITEFNRSVFSSLKKAYNESGTENFDLSLLNEYFSPEQMSRIHKMYRKRRELTVNDINTFCELCSVLKNEKKKLEAPSADKMTVDELEAYVHGRRLSVKSENTHI